MSMLSVFNKNGTTLATDQLVYTPDEIGSLDTLLEKIALLDKKLAQADADIAEAKANAMAHAEQQGFKKGRAIARRKISVALLSSQREISKQRKQMHETSVQLALEIVRRIGLNYSTPDTLLSLAMTSARELAPNETASLCVHPDIVESVQERVSKVPSEELKWLVNVVGDDSLDSQDCFLKTAHGSLFVGLESQLRVIERSLHERIS